MTAPAPPPEAVTAEGGPCKPMPCDHHWISTHEPGHAVYWVRICSQCRTANWDDLDAEVAVIRAQAAAAERERITDALHNAGHLNVIAELADLLEAGDA